MKTIAHLSDLHFGRDDPRVAEALHEDVLRQSPDLLVVSGDLTQRARRREFAACRAYLDRFPMPHVTVPGNHDIPLYDVVRRFLFPLHRFHRYIHREATPSHHDEEIAVVGLSTARSNAWANGRVSRWQLAAARRRWASAPAQALRILVTHHPFLAAPERPRSPIVGRAPQALKALEDAGADLLLCGHHHLGFSADLRDHQEVKRSILVAQAGTSLSVRRRGEPNSYNLLHATPNSLAIHVRAWDGARFVPSVRRVYRRTDSGWMRENGATGSASPSIGLREGKIAPGASL